jgi:hypothetical protein
VPVGACCYVVGGRTHDNRLIKGRQLVVVWDSAASRWITPGGWVGRGALRGQRCGKQIEAGGWECCNAALHCCLHTTAAGVRPVSSFVADMRPLGCKLPAGVIGGDLMPRSSHRAVAVPGGVLLFGGAGDGGVKSSDLHLLRVGQHGRLSWRPCGSGSSTAGAWPPGRGAHAAQVVADRLYVLGGYGEVRAAAPRIAAQVV